ncbi:SWIM zinc finger domain-containing protein [Natrialbaceae archaeon A-CW1-1]
MDEKQEPTLTEASVRELSRPQSYERGVNYYERGAVGDIVRRGDTIRADVEGSQYRPYTVTIEFDDVGVARAECSCPYDYGGICKHRVAVLLTYVRDPDRISHEQPIAEIIAQADRDTLEDLLVELVESRPEMAAWIESRLGASEVERSGDISVNLDSVHRQANHALPDPRRGHGDAYAEAERMAEELNTLIEQAQAAIEADNSETALDILEVILEVLTENRWADLLPYDVPDVYEVFDDLNKAFTEAILTTNLTDRERIDWEQRLLELDDQLLHLTGETTFAGVADVAIEGWDDDRVQRAMKGSLDEGEFWDDDSHWYEEDIVAARLAILERQGRAEEYLNLARATGQTQSYAEMLIREGNVEEAVEYGIERLSTPTELLELAKTLREHDHEAAALTVAEHGLMVDGRGKDTLAGWLRDRAASAGETDLALEAAITAFEASPSLQSYQAVEEIAGDDWEEVRPKLLDTFRRQELSYPTASRAVEVFIHEGLYDEAIEVADRFSQTSVVEPVVEAVLDERPQWAISVCKEQAEPIIEQGKHDSYRTAVHWLERAGKAARASGELDEWRAYVKEIKDEHYRKYKLRPMLEDLLEKFSE